MAVLRNKESALGFASYVRNVRPGMYGLFEATFGYDSTGRVQTSR